MALLGYFAPLWLVIKLTQSVQFQIPDWINVKAPTSSIFKQILWFDFHKNFDKTTVHFRQQMNLFPNGLIITSCCNSCYPKILDIYHIFCFSSLMKISDLTNKLQKWENGNDI